MSPNLSSAHFTQNQLLYEQVVYNIFNLIGVAGSMNHFATLQVKEQEMLTSFKDLSVDPSRCNQLCQDGFVRFKYLDLVYESPCTLKQKLHRCQK